MRKDILDRVSRFYRERLGFYNKLRSEALLNANDKELSDTRDRLKEIKLLALKGKLTPEIDKEYEDLKTKYKTLAKKYLPNIKYECDICKDTGVHNGKYCKCFVARYNRELKKATNVCDLPKFTFEDNAISDFDLSDKDSSRYNKIYTLLEQFADNYPAVDKRNIFMRGQSGSGKTCLVSAIANRLIKRDINVEYITAFDLGEMMLRSHLDYRDTSLTPLINADVLIIDDLGSEPIRANINNAYLQSIIDSRIVHNKSIIVTTNLTAEQLMKKYGERVISRLLNKTDTYAIDFGVTENLRTIKKK